MQARGSAAGEAVKRVVLDRPWLVVVAIAIAAALWWGVGTRSQEHHVKVAFDSAVNLAPGMDVQAAGVDVGKISKVSYEDGMSIVELGIDDGAAWPLHQGTTATIRFGSTAGNGNRRIELTPGPETAPMLEDGGVIGRRDSAQPIEIDEVLNTLRGPARKDLKALITNTGDALEPSSGDLNAGLGQLDNAIRPTGAVLRDLVDSRVSLAKLLRDGAGLSSTLAERREQVGDLISVTAATFDVFARNSQDVQDTIQDLPGTMDQATTTLARVDPSLGDLRTLLEDVRPGVRRLPTLARTAQPALTNLTGAARDGVALADNAVETAPATTNLLRKLAPLTTTLAPVVDRADKIAGCIAPYAPDVAGLLTNWAGYTQEYDGSNHYARARLMFGLSVFQENPIGAQATADLSPGLEYNGIPAPGALVGKPRYLPECGIDEAAAKDDWERP